MAVVKSNILGVTGQAGRTFQGFEKVIPVRATTTGALADNGIIALAYIPVEAKLTSIRLWADDLGTTGDVNLGFYPGNIPVNDLVHTDAVDEDALGTAIDVNAAALADVEVRFETDNIDTLDDAAWEIAGLTKRPDYDHFILALTASEATTAAGDIAMVIRYID